MGLLAREVGTKDTYQKVPLTFQHALTCVEVYVQRTFDEPAYSGKTSASEDITKIFVSRLSFETTLSRGGYLSLEDGTWTDDGTAIIEANITKDKDDTHGYIDDYYRWATNLAMLV